VSPDGWEPGAGLPGQPTQVAFVLVTWRCTAVWTEDTEGRPIRRWKAPRGRTVPPELSGASENLEWVAFAYMGDVQIEFVTREPCTSRSMAFLDRAATGYTILE